jgi:hypothetical protein
LKYATFDSDYFLNERKALLTGYHFSPGISALAGDFLGLSKGFE